ncbi:MAG: anti-sigma factor RsbA family regulatory protein [Actinoallomurus sp.]
MSFPAPFSHPALLYRGEREYLAGTLSFVRGGLDAGEPVAIAVPGPRLALLRARLGAAARRVRFVDMSVAGRNPGRIIPGVLRRFADAHPGQRVRVIGEPIWHGRSAAEYPACAQHEALINLAFAGRTVTILCPYDAAELDRRVLTDAAITHPVVIEHGVERVSADFDPEKVIEVYNDLGPEPVDAAALDFDADALGEVRAFATAEAARRGITGDRLLDLELAVNELAANSIVHGGGSGTLRVWSRPGHVVCEISDSGHISDPLAGRRPVAPDVRGGRGLLLVNQISDLVRISRTAGGTRVQVHFAVAR